MDWVSIVLSLGIFGVILAFVIERIWKSHEARGDKRKFLESIKKELEECYGLLRGEGNLLPTDIWKSGISAGFLRLIPYETEISLARVYFGIECHNYEAEKVRYVSILAATKQSPTATIQERIGEEPIVIQLVTPWTYAELLHKKLSDRLRQEEEKLRKDIGELLKQNIWNG